MAEPFQLSGVLHRGGGKHIANTSRSNFSSGRSDYSQSRRRGRYGLSEAIGKPVHLSNQGPESSVYEEFWPDLDGLARRDVVTEEAMPPGTFFDLATIHILTTATIDKLRELYPQGRFEPRRFSTEPDCMPQPG
jgi:hypothetical protein